MPFVILTHMGARNRALDEAMYGAKRHLANTPEQCMLMVMRAVAMIS